jgi:hypothetical protein
MYKEDSMEKEEEEEEDVGERSKGFLGGSLPSSWRGVIPAGMLFRYAVNQIG